jgi:type IV pilus assembly protein PilV
MSNRHIENQRGFTLLEVLIALLILSIGLLGLAALQTVGLRSNQMASMRTQAIQATYDISDRMRANPEGVDNQDYVIATNDPNPTYTASEDCELIDCDATQMATYDLSLWRDKVEELPDGRSQIVRSVVGTVVVHTITVFWNEERRPGVTGENCGPDPDVDLRCMTLTL